MEAWNKGANEWSGIPQLLYKLQLLQQKNKWNDIAATVAFLKEFHFKSILKCQSLKVWISQHSGIGLYERATEWKYGMKEWMNEAEYQQ